MNKQSRFLSLTLILVAGFVLAACGAQPTGAGVGFSPDGKSASAGSGSDQTGSSSAIVSSSGSSSSAVSLFGESVSSDTGHIGYTGVVETIAPDSWVVSGLTFGITAETVITDTIVVGDTVKVEALINPDSTFTATEIKLDNSEPGGEFQLIGTVESIAAD